MKLEVDSHIPCRFALFAFQETGSLQLTAVLVSSRMWQTKTSFELRDSEFTLFSGVSERFEFPIVGKLLEDILQPFPRRKESSVTPIR